VNGSPSSANCKLPDQSLYDSYPITVYGAGTIAVTSSAAFDSFVILQGDNGSPLAQAERAIQGR
jgi:hypothetical protein